MRPNMSRRAERGKPLSSPRQPRLTLARSPRYGPPVSPPCRCLVLDHDDTVVDSSPVIHYAAHVESLRAAPGMAPVDLDGWFLRTSTPASGATGGAGAERRRDDDRVRDLAALRGVDRSALLPGHPSRPCTTSAPRGTIVVVSHSESGVIRSALRKGKRRRGDPTRCTAGIRARASQARPCRSTTCVAPASTRTVLVLDDLKPGVWRAPRALPPHRRWAHRLARRALHARTLRRLLRVRRRLPRVPPAGG